MVSRTPSERAIRVCPEHERATLHSSQVKATPRNELAGLGMFPYRTALGPSPGRAPGAGEGLENSSG